MWQGWLGQEVPAAASAEVKNDAAPDDAPAPASVSDAPARPAGRPRGRPPTRRPPVTSAAQDASLLGLSPAPSGSMGQVRVAKVFARFILIMEIIILILLGKRKETARNVGRYLGVWAHVGTGL
jgi:hypothetical protein